MKRMLCIGKRGQGPNKDSSDRLAGQLNAQSGQISYDSCYLEELAFIYDGATLRVLNMRVDRDVREYDGVFLLAWFTSKQLEDSALAVSLYAEANGVAVHNTEALHSRSRSKLSECVAAALHGIAVPPFVSACDSTTLHKALISSGFQTPLVVKSTTASRGNKNYLIHDLDGLPAVIAEDHEHAFVAQAFIPNDGDYRLLVMGGEVRLAIHRRSQTDSHLNNTARGGTAALVDPATLPADMLKDAITMSRSLRREVTGVDMLVDQRDGKHYFLEVNNMPQLTTGSFVEEKAIALDAYFLSWLSAERSA